MASREQNIADFLLGVSIETLANFYDGLENVPAELLDRSTQANIGYAQVIVDMFDKGLDDPFADIGDGVGVKGIRDPEYPCSEFNPGQPQGKCEADGHYLCDECQEKKPEEVPSDE